MKEFSQNEGKKIVKEIRHMKGECSDLTDPSNVMNSE